MRRVSSQATTSASRSAASTRSVTSSRLPIGVGQTTSAPGRSVTPGRAGSTALGRGIARRVRALLERQHRRAEHPRLGAEAPPPRRAPRRAPGAARARASSSRAGPSSSSPAAITPPPITMTSGLKMLTSVASPTPSVAADRRQRAARARGSPSCASSVDERAGELRGPPRARGPAPCPAARGRRAARLAAERRARRDRLQAAAVRAVALARRAVDVDDHVAELGAARRSRRGRAARRARARRRSRCRS